MGDEKGREEERGRIDQRRMRRGEGIEEERDENRRDMGRGKDCKGRGEGKRKEEKEEYKIRYNNSNV